MKASQAVWNDAQILVPRGLHASEQLPLAKAAGEIPPACSFFEDSAGLSFRWQEFDRQETLLIKAEATGDRGFDMTGLSKGFTQVEAALNN